MKTEWVGIGFRLRRAEKAKNNKGDLLLVGVLTSSEWADRGRWRKVMSTKDHKRPRDTSKDERKRKEEETRAWEIKAKK